MTPENETPSTASSPQATSHKPQATFLALVLFSLAGSLFSRLTGLNPGPIAPVASVLTLAAGVHATFAGYVRTVPNALPRLALALALGATAEIVGLRTGFPFGRYAYTDAWWPTVRLPAIGPFPLLLPFAWLLMAGASALSIHSPSPSGSSWRGGFPERNAERSGRVRGERPPQTTNHIPHPTSLPSALLSGLLAALVDLAMEPVMTHRLGYWRWFEPGPLPGGAPLLNFFGWWATAALAGLVLTRNAPLERDEAPRWALGGFVVLILGLGLIG